MFIAYIGEDGLTHRVASALFGKNSSRGEAFCRAQGDVKMVDSDVISCEKCRASLIRSIREDLKVKEAPWKSG